MKEVRKALYVRKKFWESSSAYENRVNVLINWASEHPERELSSIFYCETIEENPIKVKGFSSK